MPKQRIPERDKAERMYLESKGDIKLIDIANELNLPEGTIRGWKNKDRWDDKLSGTFQKNTERSNKKENVKKPAVREVRLEDIDNEELTEKQRLFCLYYVQNFNATQAYLKAYGCSYATANVEGYKHLVNPRIRTEIDRLKEMKWQSIMLTEDDILERYMKIAFADMTDFVEFGRVQVPVMTMFGPLTEVNPVTGVKEPVMKEINEVRFKSSSVVDGGLICQVKMGKDGASIKLEDRQKALDWLSSYFNMNPMNRHKQEYDKRILELEAQKISLQAKKLNEEEPEDATDDGFIEALKGKVSEVWSDED